MPQCSRCAHPSPSTHLPKTTMHTVSIPLKRSHGLMLPHLKRPKRMAVRGDHIVVISLSVIASYVSRPLDPDVPYAGGASPGPDIIRQEQHPREAVDEWQDYHQGDEDSQRNGARAGCGAHLHWVLGWARRQTRRAVVPSEVEIRDCCEHTCQFGS